MNKGENRQGLPGIASVQIILTAKARGYEGETIAAEYLTKKGYAIIEKNFTVRGGEIDIIADDHGTLVFIEVKTRTSESFGHGDESLTAAKKRRIKSTIARYLNDTMKSDDIDYRVDLIEIEMPRNSDASDAHARITHNEDIEL